MDPAVKGARQSARRARGVWYFVVVIATMGLFAFVPFIHAAVRLRRASVWWSAAAYGAFTVVDMALFDAAPVDNTGTPTGPLSDIPMVAMLAVAVVACVHLVPLRRAVYGLEPPAPADVDPMVVAVMRVRERRRKARELVERDPLLARELHIGRPDIPHEYDDGGLVDLNAAPAETIARACEIDIDQAHQIVAARDGAGGLSSVADLYLHLDLPPGAWDRIRDRAITLPR